MLRSRRSRRSGQTPLTPHTECEQCSRRCGCLSQTAWFGWDGTWVRPWAASYSSCGSASVCARRSGSTERAISQKAPQCRSQQQQRRQWHEWSANELRPAHASINRRCPEGRPFRHAIEIESSWPRMEAVGSENVRFRMPTAASTRHAAAALCQGVGTPSTLQHLRAAATAAQLRRSVGRHRKLRPHIKQPKTREGGGPPN